MQVHRDNERGATVMEIATFFQRDDVWKEETEALVDQIVEIGFHDNVPNDVAQHMLAWAMAKPGVDAATHANRARKALLPDSLDNMTASTAKRHHLLPSKEE